MRAAASMLRMRWAWSWVRATFLALGLGVGAGKNGQESQLGGVETGFSGSAVRALPLRMSPTVETLHVTEDLVLWRQGRCWDDHSG